MESLEARQELKKYLHPSFSDLEIGWLGEDLSAGELPAFFYFALSLEDTLLKPPFNTPASFLTTAQARIFSATLPFHQQGQNEQRTLDRWIERESFSPFLETYLEHLADAIHSLFPFYDELHLVGLSRGAWICLQLVKRLEKRGVSPNSLTFFAPLCDFDLLLPENSLIKKEDFSCLNLDLSKQALWMSVSCQDTRVDTAKSLALFQRQQLYDPKGLREHRLILYPPIGHKGHGTPNEIFQEGAQWLLSRVKRSTS